MHKKETHGQLQLRGFKMGSKRVSVETNGAQVDKYSQMLSLTVLLLSCSLILMAQLPRASLASGVFELELLDFKRLDAGGQQAMRIVVCLKEAFASQLDGPCTYGNASIALGRLGPQLEATAHEKEEEQQEEEEEARVTRRRTTSGFVVPPVQTVRAASPLLGQPAGEQQHERGAFLSIGEALAATAAHSAEQQPGSAGNRSAASSSSVVVRHGAHKHQQQQQQQGSLMTNAVRIQFTFRWPKSFTIILSAHQVASPAGEQAEQQQQQQQQVLSSRLAPNESLSSSGGSPIDRHVLSENEVLPESSSLAESGNGGAWTSRFQRSLRSAIVYRFRVRCAQNYFGDGCTTFCRPRDDQWGHYNCSAAGQKVCLEGWFGLECERARCGPGCSPQHGFCERPHACQCRHGWTGARCDECLRYPGCQHGYCLAPWQCACQEGWGGPLCDQEVNYCAGHQPCRNNGTCVNLGPGRYRCLCAEPFGGANCELDLSERALAPLAGLEPAGCPLTPCQNGGTCYQLASSATSASASASASASGAAGAAEAASPPPPNLRELAPHTPTETNQTRATPTQSVDTPTFSSDTQGLVESLLEELGRSATKEGQPALRCHCAPGWTGDYCQWAQPVAAVLPADLLAMEQPASGLVVQGDTETAVQTSSSISSSVSPTNNELQTEEPAASQPLTTVSSQQVHLHHHLHQQQASLEMRHLVSGVVLASAVGVFLAALMLAWCCLAAIEKNRFSFIQMNIVRQFGQSHLDSPNGRVQSGATQPPGTVSSTFRRMQEKIRDSFRRRSQARHCSIKRETKLSIENVLRAPKMAPPSYEESSKYGTKKSVEYGAGCFAKQYGKNLVSSGKLESNNYTRSRLSVDMDMDMESAADSLEENGNTSFERLKADKSDLAQMEQLQTNLVTSKEVFVPLEAISGTQPELFLTPNTITDAHLNCPRHGHLYRKQKQLYSSSAEAQQEQQQPLPTTTIEIEYQPAPKRIMGNTISDIQQPRDQGDFG